MLMELAGLLVMGDLPSWTKRELARRWCCHRDTVNKVATQLSGHYNNTERPLDSSYAATLRECFPHLAAASRPEAATERPKVTDTRAYSSESKRKKERENNTPDKPAAPSVKRDQVPYAVVVDLLSSHMPGKAKPTSKRKPKLRRIHTEHGMDAIRSVGAWLTSEHPRAKYLRDHGHGLDTVIRKFDEYLELAEAPIPHDTSTSSQMSWEELERASRPETPPWQLIVGEK